VTPDTLFAMASTTKAFAATTLALLVDENKAGWDDPVRKHLPEFRLSDLLADAHVTLRDLLCHRTGLPRHDMLWVGAPWDRAEVLRRVGSAKLAAGFREKYQYQNICLQRGGRGDRTRGRGRLVGSVHPGAPAWPAGHDAHELRAG
jgi:CubicO group peptidase (beta-lactamase class C family)